MSACVRLLFLALSTLLLGACQSLESFVAVREQPQSSIPISAETQAYLQLTGLRWQDRHCRELLAALEGQPGPQAQRMRAQAELLQRAALVPSCNIDRAQALLRSARIAFRLIAEPTPDHPVQRGPLLELYNRSVTELIASKQFQSAWRNRSRSTATMSIPGLDFSLELGADAAREPDAELIAGARLAIDGLIERHIQSGLGAPLVTVIPRQSELPLRRHFFQRGAAVAATALIIDDDRGTRLSVLEPDAPAPLATVRSLNADFTAPYAWTQSRTHWRWRGFTSAFFPQQYRFARGIYLIEPYQQDKTPVLMIHGLAAGPQAWRNITNEILGTPELRRRFQVWHYFYPSGQPFLQSAAQLRADLATLRREFAADGNSGPMKPLILIGHSQGGLIARALVNQPSATLWRAVFAVGPEQLQVDETLRSGLTRALQYDPTPDIERVIFLETPHRGSSEKARPAGVRLLDLLVDKPDSLSRQLHRMHQSARDQMTPYGQTLARRGGATALESLAAESPLMQVFAAAPLAAEVRYHSIVAAQDEFLPRSSTHLPQAESELVIAGKHQETDNAATFAEIIRILHRSAAEASAQIRIR